MSIRINFLQWQICSWQEFLKDKPGSVLSQKQIKEQAWRGSSWWHCVWRLTSSLFWEHPALRAPGSLLLLQVPVCCREKVQLFAAINSINKLIRGLGNKISLMTSAHSLSNRFDSAALDSHTTKTELNYRTSNSQTLPVAAHCLSASHPALWPCLPQPLKHTSWVSKRRRFECTVYAAKTPVCLVF